MMVNKLYNYNVVYIIIVVVFVEGTYVAFVAAGQGSADNSFAQKLY